MAAALLLPGQFANAGAEFVLDRLRINHAAMLAAETDFRASRRQGLLSPTETSDYAAYIARLHRLVAEDCAALASAGRPAPAGFGCIRRTGARLAPAAIDQINERTGEEQLAGLDAELMGGLGDFDEMLLREQARIRAASPMDSAPGGADAGDSGQWGADSKREASQATDADPTLSSGEPGYQAASGGQLAGGSQAGSGNGEGMGSGTHRQRAGQRRPRDIPDGSDDDVVARQLREAAERETSPALKEKLWEEYRRYKRGTRR